jgi:ESCRT-II complex subunit VPS25
MALNAQMVMFNPQLIVPMWGAFPPFFTLQPNEATRQTQLEEWGKLLLSFCSHQKQTLVTLADCPIWENVMMQRRLGGEGVALVAGHLVSKGRAEWVDEKHLTLRVLYKTVEELAAVILEKVKQMGLYHSGETMVLSDLEDAGGEGSEFYMMMHGLEKSLMDRVLDKLQEQGHCSLIPGEVPGLLWNNPQ